MKKNFDLIYEEMVLRASGVDIIIENIEKNANILAESFSPITGKPIISEGIIIDTVKKIFSWIWTGLKTIASWTIGGISAFFKKIMEIDLIKKLCGWLFDPFLKGVDFLKGIVNDNGEKKNIVVEEAATITLTKEQFDALVEGAQKNAEKVKEEKKEGFFGRMFGWIVDHFWGLVKTLAIVAVGWIFLFRFDWIKSGLAKIGEWIKSWLNKGSEAIADSATNYNEIAQIAGQSVVKPEDMEAKQNMDENPKDPEALGKGLDANARIVFRGAEQLAEIERKITFIDRVISSPGKANTKEHARNQANYFRKAKEFLEKWCSEHDGKVPLDGDGNIEQILIAAGPEGKAIVDQYKEEQKRINEKFWRENPEMGPKSSKKYDLPEDPLYGSRPNLGDNNAMPW